MTELQIDDALGEIEPLDDENTCVLALDIGGTLVKGGVMRADRTLCTSVRIPTFTVGDRGALIDKVKVVLRDLFTEARGSCALEPLAIGVACAGLIDEADGVVRAAYNLNWSDVEIVRELESEFGLPVTLRQDARAAALIEQRIGVARGTSDFLFVAIGTGIGSALVLEGAPRAGAHHRAGEIGHIAVDAHGDACGCGERGCLEAIASTGAIARRYNRRRRKGGEDLDAEGVLAQLAVGDRLAREVWTEATDALASVLVTVQKTVDVELVVLGGGLAMAGEALLGPLELAMNAPSPVVVPPRLAVSSVGQLAGLLGAGTAALEYVASNHG